MKKLAGAYHVNKNGSIPRIINTRINELIEIVEMQQKQIYDLQSQLGRKADSINPMFPD
jgi:hypothetical protein